jgi:hypothetical protein
MMAREEQVKAIAEATRFQMETVEKIFSHFKRSEERLYGNADKARIIIDEINALEKLAEQLRMLAESFEGVGEDTPDRETDANLEDVDTLETTTEEDKDTSTETPQAG